MLSGDDDRDEIDQILGKFGLSDVARLLAELIANNDRDRNLNERTIKLAMAYGARAMIQQQVIARTEGLAFARPISWRG